MQKQVIQQTVSTQQTQQTVTQQQVQLSHLLELPAEGMEDEMRKALEENPALERNESDDERDASFLSSADLLPQMPDFGRVRRSNDASEASPDEYLASTETDADALTQQIALLNLTPTEHKVMDYIAGSLNDNGFLEKDDQTLADELAFGLYLDISTEEVHRLVGLFQTLDPSGIGAHSLQECLALQLARRLAAAKDTSSAAALQTALRLVRNAWTDYADRRLDRVANSLKITCAALDDAEAQIRKCNPRPGLSLTASTQHETPTVRPDFLLAVDDYGQVDITLAQQHETHLKVRHEFLDIVERYPLLTNPSRTEHEAYVYAKEKVDRATAYIDNLQRRQQMLLGTMREIARRQHDFFTHEDDEALLQPMRLQDVADRLGVNISTVSRAANSKYVQTLYGIYPLRYFFNAQAMEKDGQMVSNTQLKLTLREIIEGEDTANPYSDEQLAILMQEKGYKIARRTVAKYRINMGILPAHKRRK